MPSSKALLDARGLKPKKSWGQNFLMDKNALDRIVQASELSDEDRLLVEIGAGAGALTERLVAPDRTVVAVERDRDMAAILRERFEPGGGVEVAEANALDFTFGEVFERAGRRVKVVGNLPYQISGPLLFHLLENREFVRSAHVLLQREVAVRLAATVGEPDYSALSVIFARAGEVRRGPDVKRACFYPTPKVDSRFVSVFFHPPGDRAAVRREAYFRRFVKAAFHQRRKKLKNSLEKQPFLSIGREAMERLERRFGEELSLRAERLSVEIFEAMAACLEEP